MSSKEPQLHFLSKMGKDKKKDKSLNESKIEDKSLNESKIGEENGEEMSYEDRLKHVSIIAKPMANKKLAKKVFIINFLI